MGALHLTDEMRRNMEGMMAQLEDRVEKLRKKEQATIAKVDAERSQADKMTSRRNFYEKLQSNMVRGLDEATSKLKAAEESEAAVRQRVAELESSKAELRASLDKVVAQNELTVLPELERLETLLQASKDEIAVSSRALADDEQRLDELTRLKETVDAEEKDLQSTAEQKKGALSDLLAKPATISASTKSSRRDAEAIQSELDGVEGRKKEVQEDINQQHQRRTEIDEQKNAEIEKLRCEQQTLEEKRPRVESCKKDLSEERVRQHSLASQRVEIELHTKKTRDEIRHSKSALATENRQVKLQKASLIKQQQQTPQTKAKRDELQSKLQELRQMTSLIEAERKSLQEVLASVKSKVESSVMKLFDEEYVEEDALERLDSTMKAVAEKEYEIEEKRAEEKKESTLVTLMKEKRAVTRRKIEQMEQVKRELANDIAFRNHQQNDLTKKVRDTEKRAADFVTLHQMLQGEKSECTRLISETKRALQELRLRTEEYERELRVKSEERDLKMKTLHEETDARTAAQHARATKRSEKCNRWSGYRILLEEVERQEASIDRLKTSLSNSKSEVSLAASQTEQLAGVKQSMTEQLQERKAQLASLFESANDMKEAVKKGELGIQRVQEETHMIDLKNKDIQRSIALLERELQSDSEIEAQIADVKGKLEVQVLETERIVSELECPSRITYAPGEDPSAEELEGKLSILERLLARNREVMLAREISSKELSIRIQQQEESNQNWKASTHALLQETNEYKGRILELTRRRTAQMSEMRLYDELVASNRTKIAQLRHDLALREQLAIAEDAKALNNGVTSGDSLVTQSQSAKRLSCERPTAYMPADENELTLKVPRPYGALAPFQAHKPGAAMMRHTKKPALLDPLLP